MSPSHRSTICLGRVYEYDTSLHESLSTSFVPARSLESDMSVLQFSFDFCVNCMLIVYLLRDGLPPRKLSASSHAVTSVVS